MTLRPDYYLTPGRYAGTRYTATPTAAHPSLRAILGPCPCQECGHPVYWARANTRLNGETIPGAFRWREITGRIHVCIIRRRRAIR